MILLDTHVLIWLVAKSKQLGSQSLELIDKSWKADAVYVSAITFWEIALLRRKNLQLSPDLLFHCRELLTQGLKEVAIDGKIAIKSVELQNLPKDPADRFIVATALKGYRLITADQRILDWSGRLNSLDARL